MRSCRHYNNEGYVVLSHGKTEHRLVVEQVLGRELKASEIVHHVDGNRENNTKSNLVLCPSRAYHHLIHVRQRVVDAGGNPNKDKWCSFCKTIHDKTEFYGNAYSPDGLNSVCKEGMLEYQRRNRAKRKAKRNGTT